MDAILVLNAGSSSLKFSAYRAGSGEAARLFHGQVKGLGTRPQFELSGGDGEAVERTTLEGVSDHDAALTHIAEHVRQHFGGLRLVAVGHRVVHGGVAFTGPARITDTVLAELEKLSPLAPLHQPHCLAGIRAVSRQAPDMPQVACFDTAFHRTQPEVAQRFGLPRRYHAEGVIRYGFHGLSYEYIASVLPRFDARAATGKTVVAHLGNGASMCALSGGRSVATTMSFTPVDGLLMGTRCGAVDPGAVLYLMARDGLSPALADRLINHESGLLGVSGVSSDMRTLLASGDARAAEAVDLFVYRIARELGSLAAALGGLDALVFTGGIGENATVVRERICLDAAWLGVEVDADANRAGGPRVSMPGSRVSVWVIPTDEDRIIAGHTRQMLQLGGR